MEKETITWCGKDINLLEKDELIEVIRCLKKQLDYEKELMDKMLDHHLFLPPIE